MHKVQVFPKPKRCMSFWIHHFPKTFMNLGMMSVVISMLIATFCLHKALEIFKRIVFAIQSTFHAAYKMKLEIQFVCGL